MLRRTHRPRSRSTIGPVSPCVCRRRCRRATTPSHPWGTTTAPTPRRQPRPARPWLSPVAATLSHRPRPPPSVTTHRGALPRLRHATSCCQWHAPGLGVVRPAGLVCMGLNMLTWHPLHHFQAPTAQTDLAKFQHADLNHLTWIVRPAFCMGLNALTQHPLCSCQVRADA